MHRFGSVKSEIKLDLNRSGQFEQHAGHSGMLIRSLFGTFQGAMLDGPGTFADGPCFWKFVPFKSFVKERLAPRGQNRFQVFRLGAPSNEQQRQRNEPSKGHVLIPNYLEFPGGLSRAQPDRSAHAMARKYADLALPASISMRVVYLNLPLRDKYNGFQRVAFLTNLPRQDYSLEQLSDLALRRWTHETINADIKSRLDLSDVRGLSPHTVRHEVMSHLCLNNILRLLFVRALGPASLEASVQTGLEALRGANNQARYNPGGSEITDLLLALIREARLKKRPNRTEPRMTRPRRRPYPMFKDSRAEWRAQRKGGLEKTESE